MINIDDPTVKTDLHNAIKLIHDEFVKVADSRDVVKDIVNEIYAKHKIPKPLVRKLSRAYHKRNVSEIVAEASEINALYKSITA